jgi:hypothetical protein
MNLAFWASMELLKKYCTRLFSYKRDELIKPRLHMVDLDAANTNLQQDKVVHTITVDATKTVLIEDIERLKADIEKDRSAKKRK